MEFHYILPFKKLIMEARPSSLHENSQPDSLGLGPNLSESDPYEVLSARMDETIGKIQDSGCIDFGLGVCAHTADDAFRGGEGYNEN